MEQPVRVRKVFEDGTAEVIHLRQSACSGDCHKCSGCGAVQQTLLIRADNPIGAKAGELVILRSDTGVMLGAAAMLYVLPLILFFAGYLIGELAMGKGALIGCICFAAGVAAAVFAYRRTAKRSKIQYTITGFARPDQVNL